MLTNTQGNQKWNVQMAKSGTRFKAGEKFYSHSKKTNYELQKELGHGGQGSVWRANNDENEQVAIKISRFGNSTSGQEAKARFNQEVKTLLSLSGCQGIVDVLDYSQPDDEVLWYTMPIGIPSETMRNFSIHRKVECLIQLAKTLSFLHSKGYCHRDLKPENLLFFGDTITICDFGLVRNNSDSCQLTLSHEKIGNKYFSAPEMSRPNDLESNDQTPADVYSFGKLVWYFLSGGYFSYENTARKRAKLSFPYLYPFFFEPIIELAERTIIDIPSKRIKIKDCLKYLTDFLTIIEDMDSGLIRKYKTVYCLHETEEDCHFDYRGISTVSEIASQLNRLADCFCFDSNYFFHSKVFSECTFRNDINGIVFATGNNGIEEHCLCFPCRMDYGITEKEIKAIHMEFIKKDNLPDSILNEFPTTPNIFDLGSHSYIVNKTFAVDLVPRMN